MSDAARIASLEASLNDAYANERRLCATIAELRARLHRVAETAILGNPAVNPVPITRHLSMKGYVA